MRRPGARSARETLGERCFVGAEPLRGAPLPDDLHRHRVAARDLRQQLGSAHDPAEDARATLEAHFDAFARMAALDAGACEALGIDHDVVTTPSAARFSPS